jgi:2-iminobutanoate/2-iminopropanoate deaminase
MMQPVQTPNAPAAVGPYTQAIAVGQLVYLSGQIALDPVDGRLVGDDVPTQTEQIVKNISAVLEAAGSSLENVVKTTCFLTDMADFAAFNEVYARHFVSRPARSCVAVRQLPAGALVEIETIALKK